MDEWSTSTYYLGVQKNKYRFSFTPNLIKMLADRRASIDARKIDETVRAEIQRVFSANDPSVPGGVERRFFPERSSDVPNRPTLTLAILGADKSMADKAATLRELDTMTRDCGASSRTFKSAIVWCVADTATSLENEARKLLAWQEIKEDEASRLDENQIRQLEENLKKSKRDLQEAVWRAYRYIALLGKDNSLRVGDMGLVNSSMANSMTGLVLQQLKKDGEIEQSISPNFLLRNWPPAFTEWSTKSIRDAFFASPMFPKLMNGEQTVKDTIARGVHGGMLGYVGKKGDGRYAPFHFAEVLSPLDVEISDDMFVIAKETAEAYKQAASMPPPSKSQAYDVPGPTLPAQVSDGKAEEYVPGTQTDLPPGPTIEVGVSAVRWKGQVPPQKWMNFYTKVLSRYAAAKALKINLDVVVSPDGGLTKCQMEDIRTALRELGLSDEMDISE